MREAADDDRAELVAKAADLSLRARMTTRNAVDLALHFRYPFVDVGSPGVLHHDQHHYEREGCTHFDKHGLRVAVVADCSFDKTSFT